MRSSVYPGISKKFILIPVKECLNNRVELALKTKGKQAKSKVAFCPCTSLCAPRQRVDLPTSNNLVKKTPMGGPASRVLLDSRCSQVDHQD